MAGATTALEVRGINHFFRATADVPDATPYLGLYTSPPDNAGAGGTEVSGSDYARQLLYSGSSSFSAASNGQIANSGTITFTAAATNPGYGTVTHFGIFAASSGGTPIFWWPLTTNVTVGTGSSFTFAAGDLTISGPSNMTTGFKNQFLEHFFRNNAQTTVAAAYLGLHGATAPAADGTGGSELSVAWYTSAGRQAVTFTAPSGTPETTSNSGALTFSASTPANGGNVAYGAIYRTSTGSTGGSNPNMIMFAPFNVVFSTDVGANVSFPIGQISLTLD